MVMEHIVGELWPGAASYWRMAFDAPPFQPFRDIFFLVLVGIFFSAFISFIFLGFLHAMVGVDYLEGVSPFVIFFLASLCFAGSYFFDNLWGYLQMGGSFNIPSEMVRLEEEYKRWMASRAETGCGYVLVLISLVYIPLYFTYPLSISLFISHCVVMIGGIHFIAAQYFRVFVQAYRKWAVRWFLVMCSSTLLYQELLSHETKGTERNGRRLPDVGGVALTSTVILWMTLTFHGVSGYRWQWLMGCGEVSAMIVSRFAVSGATVSWVMATMVSHLVVALVSGIMAYHREYLSRFNFKKAVLLRAKGVVYFPMPDGGVRSEEPKQTELEEELPEEEEIEEIVQVISSGVEKISSQASIPPLGFPIASETESVTTKSKVTKGSLKTVNEEETPPTEQHIEEEEELKVSSSVFRPPADDLDMTHRVERLQDFVKGVSKVFPVAIGSNVTPHSSLRDAPEGVITRQEDRIFEFLSIDILSVMGFQSKNPRMRRRRRWTMEFRSKKVEQLYQIWENQRVLWRVRIASVMFVVFEGLTGVWDMVMARDAMDPIHYTAMVRLRYIVFVPITALFAAIVWLSTQHRGEDTARVAISCMLVGNCLTWVGLIMWEYMWVNTPDLWMVTIGFATHTVFRLTFHVFCTFRLPPLLALLLGSLISLLLIVVHFAEFGKAAALGPIAAYPSILGGVVWYGFFFSLAEAKRYRDQFALQLLEKLQTCL